MTEPLFPEPLDDDDDDVAWALQTAKAQWSRGGHADAMVWLGRAADAADQLGQVWRAADLRRVIQELVQSSARPAPPPPPAPIAAPLPRWESASDLSEDTSEVETSGVTSIPPRLAAGQLSSYAPVDDYEVEDELEDIEEVEAELEVEELAAEQAPNDRVAQLLGTEVEVTADVELLDPDEEQEFEADVIEDDALGAPNEPNTERDLQLGEESDDPVTEPHLDDPRLLDIARRSSLPLPRSEPARVAVSAPDPEPESEPQLGDVLLGEVRGLEDVPPEGQRILAREAQIERLNRDEEVRSFGLALVLHGAVNVMPAIADLSCARAGKGEIVWSQGNLEEGIALRLVAASDATEVAVWDAELLKSTVRDYPWVVEDLRALADRFQALAGVAMGAMGERLDDSLRATVTDRCEIRRLLPGERLTTQGKAVGGMYIVGAGRVEIIAEAGIEAELGPGDFLFAPQVLSNGSAPRDSRAGQGGALVLFAARSVAHELLLSVPPLLEIFAT